ncbi:MAG: hypothetical protein PW734_00360 [Verrucomicrobium sp.]|nr:hypothetical protein [Verrucomicrobium sp.]
MEEPKLHQVKFTNDAFEARDDRQRADIAELGIVAGRSEEGPVGKFTQAFARLRQTILAAVFQRQATLDQTAHDHVVREKLEEWMERPLREHQAKHPSPDLTAIRQNAAEMRHAAPQAGKAADGPDHRREAA